MAGFGKVPYGVVEQFLSRLAQAGGDEALLKGLSQKPDTMQDMVEWAREQLRQVSHGREGLFATPQEMLQTFRNANMFRGWHFTDAQLDQLAATMPTDHISRLNSALTLDVWFGDINRTFWTLWDWAETRVGGAEVGIRRPLRFGGKLRRQPREFFANQTVQWGVLDLTVNAGKSPNDLRDADDLAGTSLLAAAALHTEWLLSLGRSNAVPAVWLGRVEARESTHGDWNHVPVLYRGSKGLKLDFNWRGVTQEPRVIPTFRAL